MRSARPRNSERAAPSGDGTPRAPFRPPWAPLALVAAVIVAYLPVGRAGFIWNDSDYVTAPALRSWAGLVRIWTEVGATEQYYPLLHSWFWVQSWVFGDAPLGYHVVNVLAHAVAAVLLALVSDRRGAEALPVLEELVRRQPANADARRLLAQTLWELGRRDEAQRLMLR